VAQRVLYVYTTVMCLQLIGTKSIVYTTVMCLLLSGTQFIVRVRHTDVSTAEWHTEYSTCTLQWCVDICVAHRVLYLYTTVMCLPLSGTKNTVRVHYIDVSTAECHTEYCTWKLLWRVYSLIAHRLIYVYNKVMCLLLSATQNNVRVNNSYVSTAEWHRG
jgi:hypothetical protein